MRVKNLKEFVEWAWDFITDQPCGTDVCPWERDEDGNMEVVEMAFNELRELENDGWISIKDDKPPEDTPVMVYSPTQHKKMICMMQRCTWRGEDEITWLAVTTRNSVNRFTWKVTHWMPLPDDPVVV